MLMHHNTGYAMDSSLFKNISTMNFPTTTTPSPTSSPSMGNVDWSIFTKQPTPSPTSSPSLANVDWSIFTKQTTKTTPGLRAPVDSTPQVVYVEKEVPAETPWLLILLAVAAAYYMGKKK